MNFKKNPLSEWRKMSRSYIDKVIAPWPKRVFMIYSNRASHIEHRLKL